MLGALLKNYLTRRGGYSLLSALSGICFSLSSMFWDRQFGPFLVLLSVLLLVAIVDRLKNADRLLTEELMIWSLSFHLSAFYWLPDTLTFFGGFPKWLAFGLFLLFACISSLQFWFVARLWRIFKSPILLSSGLAFPLAWGIAEFFTPRLFPWALAHPLVNWSWFSLLASYVGGSPLSVLLLWLANRIIAIQIPFGLSRQVLALVLVCSICLFLSFLRSSELSQELSKALPVKVALIQGNLAAEDKGNLRLLSANLEKYRELSLKASVQGAELLLWPESVMNVWTPEESAQVRGERFDPFPDATLPLIYGSLSFSKKKEKELSELERSFGENMKAEMQYNKYNSVFGLDAEGNVLGRYHKKILMPLGEYLPFADKFPWIRNLSPQSGDFTSGVLDAPIEVSLPRTSSVLALGPLICYEDLVPQLSLKLVQNGADVLINLTNDAWYGDTFAPHQHHLLASWRAIEAGRFLLRATNTGLTGVIRPDGKTIATLKPFTEDILLQEVYGLKSFTFYSIYGDIVSWSLVFLSVCIIASSRIRAPQ